MSRAETTKQKFSEAILKLEMEKQLRCGDGFGGLTTSHSINCNCEQLDRDIKRVKKQRGELQR